MTIPEVGGQPPPIDPQKVQQGEAIKEYGLIIGKIGTMQRQFKDITEKLASDPDHDLGALTTQLKGLLKEIRTITKQLESMKDSGQLDFLFGNPVATFQALKKINNTLNSAEAELRWGLESAATGSNPEGALGSSLGYVTRALDKIVELS